MLWLSIAVLILAANTIFLMRHIWKLENMINMLGQSLNDIFANHKLYVETSNKEFVSILGKHGGILHETFMKIAADHEAMKEVVTLLRDMKEPPVAPKKEAPANRKPRTEAEKLAASQKRKEWWEKKRAEEAADSSAPQAIQPPQPTQNA